MKKKQYMVAMGEHFHKMFDDVLIAVMENSNPYLIGPSGCGKTFMVSQIARILGMDFIDIGYINEEYDILGFQTANGGYSRPNFYRCYKYGKIAFCDELDNGNSRATVKLNSFLSNLKEASYSFPNGENVRRHPNFRIIGAGNTDGNGADSNYNSREKIEESVQQRFTPIYIGYDNEVEKKILADYPDWYSFLVLFRMATDEWGRNNYGDAPGIITTRDATRIKKYRDNNSFDMEKILEYEFIQTKDITYLAFIEDHIKKNIAGYENASTIFNAFSSMINSRRG
jgi:ABC-type dipeptide/oligopeptide/nickel transport system ATPase component